MTIKESAIYHYSYIFIQISYHYFITIMLTTQILTPIKYPHRQSCQRERKHIRCQHNDYGNNRDNHDCVLAVMVHKRCGDKSQLGEKPRKYRYLKNNPHSHRHHHQRGYIRLQRNHIRHLATHLTIPPKTESQRKDQVVTDKHPSMNRR